MSATENNKPYDLNQFVSENSSRIPSPKSSPAGGAEIPKENSEEPSPKKESSPARGEEIPKGEEVNRELALKNAHLHLENEGLFKIISDTQYICLLAIKRASLMEKEVRKQALQISNLISVGDRLRVKLHEANESLRSVKKIYGVEQRNSSREDKRTPSPKSSPEGGEGIHEKEKSSVSAVADPPPLKGGLLSQEGILNKSQGEISG